MQIHVLISTHQGVLYNEYCDYVVIQTKENEYAILANHVPLISTIKEGYIKLVDKKNNFEVYVAVNEGALIFNQNTLSVGAEEAFVGNTKQRAKELLLENRHSRLEHNRTINTELEIAERKLKENIKEAKAGNLWLLI